MNPLVIAAAVVIAVGVMMFAARPIGDFVDRHPSVKMLALSFLILVGFTLMLDRLGTNVEGQNCVLLGGSGGVAKAVIEALRTRKAKKLYLVTRDPSGRICEADTEWIGYDALPDLSAALLVNCTPVGMYPNVDASPLAPGLVKNFGAVADTIYNPLETRLMHDAREAGIPTENGLYMLVAQAIAAQEIWQGEKYPIELTNKIFDRLSEGIRRGDY